MLHLIVTLTVVYFIPTATSSGYSEIHRKQDAHGNYDFGYGIKDDNHGSESFHKESGDHANNKWGSYGMRDADGRWRIVNYIADKNGFRAAIQSNEPGVAPLNPAHVSINEPMNSVYSGHNHQQDISGHLHEPLARGYIQDKSHEIHSSHDDDEYDNDDHYGDIGHQVEDNLHLDVPAIDAPIPGLDAVPIAAAAATSHTSSSSQGEPEGKQMNITATVTVSRCSTNSTTNCTVKPTMKDESTKKVTRLTVASSSLASTVTKEKKVTKVTQ